MVCLSQGNIFGKPSPPHTVQVRGKESVIKDVARKFSLYAGHSVWWLIQREMEDLFRLSGITGIPKPVARIDALPSRWSLSPGDPSRGEKSCLPLFSKNWNRSWIRSIQKEWSIWT